MASCSPHHGLRAATDYPSTTVELLRFIKRTQELGFTLDEVEELLHLDAGGPQSCDAVRALAETRRADLDARIADLRRMSDSLTDLIATCQHPTTERVCALLDSLADPDRPPTPAAHRDYANS